MSNTFKVGDVVKRTQITCDEFLTTKPVIVTKVKGNYIGFCGGFAEWHYENFILVQKSTDQKSQLTEEKEKILKALMGGEIIEVLNEKDQWEIDQNVFLSIAMDKKLRIRPKIVIINNMEVLAPLTEFPANCTHYYYVDFDQEGGVCCRTFSGKGLHSRDHNRLSMGISHLNREDAVKHFKALIKPTRNTV